MNRCIAPILVIAAAAACAPRTEEVHLLPPGFTGPVLIIFGQRDGVPPEYRGRARVYRIPPSGVLMTQFPINPGSVDAKFYRVDIDTLGSGIPELIGAEEQSAGSGLYVFHGETGSQARGEPLEVTYVPPGPLFEYLSYYVGHLPAADSIFQRGDRMLDRIVDSISARASSHRN